MNKPISKQRGSREQTKIRVLLVAKFLNEGRKLSANDICRRLDIQYGIIADRKTIMSDVQAVDKIMPIEVITGSRVGYQKMKFY